MKKVYIFIGTIWAFIISNSKQPDSSLWKITSVSSNWRVFEICFFLSIFFYALFLNDKRIRDVKIIIVGNMFFIYIGVIGILINTVLIWYEQVLGIIYYLLPFYIFISSVILKINLNDLKVMLKFYLFLIILNIIVLFIQLPEIKSLGDEFYGLLSDSHLIGSLINIASIFSFFYYIKLKNKLFLLFSLSLLGISFLPQNEKTIILNLVLLFSMILTRYNSKAKYIILSSVVVTIFFLILYVIPQFFGKGVVVLRVEYLLDKNIFELGILKSWYLAFNKISANVITLLLGIGSGNYGGFAAGRIMLQNINTSNYFYDMVILGKVEGSFDFEVNTFTNCLAEYGSIGFIIYILILFIIYKKISKYKFQNIFDLSMLFLFKIIFVFLVFQGLFTPYTNFSESLLIFPCFTIAGYLYNGSFTVEN